MRAVIVAGGRGVRLRPYTTCIPKPLVPIGGESPILEVLLKQLRRCGVDRVTLAVGHMGHLIRSYVGDGSQWDLAVDYWDEDQPLGTIGPLLGHLDELPERFLVLNGDLLCDIDFADLMAFHVRLRADLTVAAYTRTMHVDFGVLDVVGPRLQGFREKPRFDYLVNMGIYALSRDVLSGFEVGAPLGFDQLVSALLDGDAQPCTYRFDGYWRDIGRPEDYDLANDEFPSMRSRLLGTHPVPSERDDVVIDLKNLDNRRTAGPIAQPRKRVTA